MSYYMDSPFSGTLILRCKCHFCDAIEEHEVVQYRGSAIIFPLKPSFPWEEILYEGYVIWNCGRHIIETTVRDRCICCGGSGKVLGPFGESEEPCRYCKNTAENGGSGK